MDSKRAWTILLMTVVFAFMPLKAAPTGYNSECSDWLNDTNGLIKSVPHSTLDYDLLTFWWYQLSLVFHKSIEPSALPTARQSISLLCAIHWMPLGMNSKNFALWTLNSPMIVRHSQWYNLRPEHTRESHYKNSTMPAELPNTVKVLHVFLLYNGYLVLHKLSLLKNIKQYHHLTWTS